MTSMLATFAQQQSLSMQLLVALDSIKALTRSKAYCRPAVTVSESSARNDASSNVCSSSVSSTVECSGCVHNATCAL
eukprot:12644-Heterococcus_DN1.PRE.1